MPPAEATLGIFVDVFNATNQGTPNLRYPFAVVDVSGQNFGQPGAWIDPRTIRTGARLTFSFGFVRHNVPVGSARANLQIIG